MEKKILVPTIIGIVTLTILIFGATYAYFTMNSTNNFGTKELNAKIDSMTGSVMLSQETSSLSLEVTREQMQEENMYETYYASGGEEQSAVAKMSVSGAGTFKCDYTLTVTKSASSPENDLFIAYQQNSLMTDKEISLYLNSDEYDFVNADTFPITYTDTMYNITEQTPKYITSNLMIYNTSWDQNYLKGKDITLTYDISGFNCELSEPTGEYINLAFTHEYMDDIGNGWIIYVDGFAPISKDLIIPETFQGKDGKWYKVTSIENVSADVAVGFETMELPNSLESIDHWAFHGLSLDVVKLPKQLKSVGDYVFAASDVTTIYMPKSLTTITNDFFRDSDIENIYYEGTEAEWNKLNLSFQYPVNIYFNVNY